MKLIEESPSLRPYPAKVLADEYSYALGDAAEETGLDVATFPETCPYSIDQLLDLQFYPVAG